MYFPLVRMEKTREISSNHGFIKYAYTAECSQQDSPLMEGEPEIAVCVVYTPLLDPNGRETGSDINITATIMRGLCDWQNMYFIMCVCRDREQLESYREHAQQWV